MLKVISGGQTGVDLAGLDAAKKNGFKTGGWMPRRWQNLEGHQPHFAELYGMNEHKNVGYAPRTKQNIVDSDGTLIIATNLGSSGTRLTITTTKLFRKKVLICDLNFSVDTIYNWIIDNKFEIINVAGNSEQTSPGIYNHAFNILDQVFYKIKTT